MQPGATSKAGRKRTSPASQGSKAHVDERIQAMRAGVDLVLGNTTYRRLVLTFTRQIARRQIRPLVQSQAIDPATWRRIRPTLVHHILMFPLSLARGTSPLGFVTLSLLAVSLVLAGTRYFPQQVAILQTNPTTWGERLLWLGVSILALGPLLVVVLFRKIQWTMVVLAGFTLLAYGAANTASYWAPVMLPGQVVPEVPVWGSLLALLYMHYLLYVGLTFAGLYLILRINRRRMPETYCVWSLISAIRAVERGARSWSSVATRRKVIRHIEEAARCIEYAYAQALRSGDPATDAWTKNAARHIAGHIRGLQRWVVTPRPETRAALQAELVRLLVIATEGQWGQLEWDPNAPVADKVPWYMRAWTVTRAIILAVLPLTLFLLYQRFGDPIQGSLRDTVALTTVVWGVISLVINLDPLFATKVSSLKEIGSLFTGGK